MKRLTETLPNCSIFRGALLLAAVAAWPASLPAAEVDACPTSFATAVDYATVRGSGAVAIGDLNDDGRPDLALANLDSNSVSVLLGNGDGTLAAAVHYEVGTPPGFLAIGDLNRDGRADLVVASPDGSGISMLQGNGDGTFAAAVHSITGVRAASMAIGDLNDDGHPDLALSNLTGDSVSVLLGNADGTFEKAVDHAAGGGPGSVAIGDLDADGRLDVAVANGRGISVLPGNGNGTFAAAVQYGTGVRAASMAIGDLNADGEADVAVANLAGDGVSVLLGNGDGTFAAPVRYASGGLFTSVAVGDLNADGKPDLVATHSGGASVSVLLNRTAACGAAAGVSPCCQDLQFDCFDYDAICVDTSSSTCECATFCGESGEPCPAPAAECVDVANEPDVCGVSHGTTSTCLAICGFMHCAAGDFCCNGDSCCKGGSQVCIGTFCQDICPPDEFECGPGPNCCKDVGEICQQNTCYSDCGNVFCDPVTEICCNDDCCDLNTQVCGPSNLCEPIAVCGPEETLIEDLNYCCNTSHYCPTWYGGDCCNIVTQLCSPTPEGTACVPRDGSPSPGEVSRTIAMLVTDYDKLTGNVTVSYDPACGTTGNTVHYGDLGELLCTGTYLYSGRVCGLDNTGTATFDVPEGSYFVVVGRNDLYEGSYGTKVVEGTPTERPVDWTNTICPLPLNLVDRCD